jgi:hypothetical protein
MVPLTNKSQDPWARFISDPSSPAAPAKVRSNLGFAPSDFGTGARPVSQPYPTALLNSSPNYNHLKATKSINARMIRMLTHNAVSADGGSLNSSLAFDRCAGLTLTPPLRSGLTGIRRDRASFLSASSRPSLLVIACGAHSLLRENAILKLSREPRNKARTLT